MAEQGTGHRQRLKERFLAGEPSAHGDEVLLELLLTYAIPRLDVQPLARRLVAQFGSLRAVLGAERSELARVHGLGEAAVTLLKLADHLAGAPATARIPRGEPDPLSAHAAGREITINTEARRHGGDGRGAARSGKRLDGPPDGFADTGASTRDSAGAVSMGGPDESAAGMSALSMPEAAASAPDAPKEGDDPTPLPRAARTRRVPAKARPVPDAAPATRWRATGRYSAVNMLKPGMVAEIRIALDAYARLGDLAATRRYLQDAGLPQRSRATRNTVVTVIGERLASWNPPRWVCADLIAASAGDLAGLKLLLLLHTARQDALLYALVQEVVVPRWHAGVTALSQVEMQRFLDDAAPTHPEIHTWSRATRIKLAGSLLTVLRDYGLLVGGATKRIVAPVVSPFAAGHLARLLAAEGSAPEQIADHPDWALWLLSPERARTLLGTWEGSAP